MKSNQKIAALAGVATALLICCFMGAYALTNYATPFQIQPVNATNNTQTVAIGSGCTLGSDAGSTINLSSGTLTLPAFSGCLFNGSNGTGNCSLVGSSSGQKVLCVFDCTGGTATAAGSATASSFAATISGTGVLTQTSTANLSGHVFEATLINQGP